MSRVIGCIRFAESRRDGRCVSRQITELHLAGRAIARRKSILKTIAKNKLPAVHPGEILRENVLPDSGLSIAGAAKALRVSRQMLHEILAERRPLSAQMCLK